MLSKIWNAIHSLLGGSSPITGYFGSAGIVMSLLQLYQDFVVTNGVPTNKLEWIMLVCSIGLRFAKDANKSNAPNPAATPKTVG